MPMIWSISRISPLGALLKLARDSGRVVILASDHGHVWHRPDARASPRRRGAAGGRTTGDVQDGEIADHGEPGPRREGQNAVIVPWSETIYYERQQNGYHGGATPQEMVCPLVILTDKSSAYSGPVPLRIPEARMVVLGPHALRRWSKNRP